MLKLTRLYTLNMCRLLYVNDTLIKMWEKKHFPPTIHLGAPGLWGDAILLLLGQGRLTVAWKRFSQT